MLLKLLQLKKYLEKSKIIYSKSTLSTPKNQLKTAMA